ncbi:fluoride efflux transporter FluC [Streptomyces sp. NPDC058374]|uniref:fluoride efflux transporter FluC n=1 Tax=Streptomyces sp. NPDC058374 TaxID=3346466 RepID=UPI0036641F3C
MSTPSDDRPEPAPGTPGVGPRRADLPPPPPEPVDPDLGPGPAPGARPESQLPVLLAISLGGGAGAAVRYGATVLWPTPSGAFPWTILLVNAAGCAGMGVLMALLTEVWRDAPRLVRPFLGTGVLGGFTTFSAYALDVQTLLESGRPGRALGGLALTVVAALAAVTAGSWLTRRAVRLRSGRPERSAA